MLYILTNVVIVFIFHGVILYHLRKRLRSSCCRRRGRLAIGVLSVGIAGFNLVGSYDGENVRTQRVERDDADVPRAVNSSLGTYRSGEDGLDQQEGQMLIHLSNWSLSRAASRLGWPNIRGCTGGLAIAYWGTMLGSVPMIFPLEGGVPIGTGLAFVPAHVQATSLDGGLRQVIHPTDQIFRWCSCIGRQ